MRYGCFRAQATTLVGSGFYKCESGVRQVWELKNSDVKPSHGLMIEGFYQLYWGELTHTILYSEGVQLDDFLKFWLTYSVTLVSGLEFSDHLHWTPSAPHRKCPLDRLFWVVFTFSCGLRWVGDHFEKALQELTSQPVRIAGSINN